MAGEVDEAHSGSGLFPDYPGVKAWNGTPPCVAVGSLMRRRGGTSRARANEGTGSIKELSKVVCK